MKERLVRGLRNVRNIRVRTVVRLLAVLVGLALTGVLLLAIITVVATHNHKGSLPPENVAQVVIADQGWGDGAGAKDRQTYYYTSQGAALKDVRYSWFVNLEMPLSKKRLLEPDVIRRFGFLVDGPSEMNPDGLPVGFSKFYDEELKEGLLDITCAACHTGQINVTDDRGRTTAVRIDGGSAIHAFTDSNMGHFVPTLLSSMMSTAANPMKFRRFARRVLGDHDLGQSLTLHRELVRVIGKLAGMGITEKRYGLVPNEEGYGRTDALARISNTVFGDNIDPANYHIASAPVNYPPVWNIWKFDWVQYNASVSQPMARNIGETMGTGAKYQLMDRYGRALPPAARFSATSNLHNLDTIETTLWKLKPPKWNEAVMGRIDWPLAARGKALFEEHCEGCHGPFVASPAKKAQIAPLKAEYEPVWLIRTVCVGDIGTDPNAAMNFVNSYVDITKTGMTTAELQAELRKTLVASSARKSTFLTSEIARLRALPQTPETAKQIAANEKELAGLAGSMEAQLAQLNPARLPAGLGLSFIGGRIRDGAYTSGRYTPQERERLDGFGMIDQPAVLAAYKPRPLGGMWASAPFLHNGSVPTIYDLLSPVEERPKSFRVGSREYDTKKLGLKQVGDPYWMYEVDDDTKRDKDRRAGNSNKGHEFSREYQQRSWDERAKNGVIGPYLSEADRYAIIEHLKVRDDDVDASPKHRDTVPQFGQNCAPVPTFPANARVKR